MKTWPFDQPPDCAVITVRQIVEGTAPILEVTHDSDDHGWQFLPLEAPDEEDLVIVCFSHVIERDPSLVELAGLEPGWIARRASVDQQWQCEPNPYEEDEEDEPR